MSAGCQCVCHAGVGGLWRTHVCEHCAPGYFARRGALAHEHELRQAGQGTDHPADHAEQGPTVATLGRQRSAQ